MGGREEAVKEVASGQWLVAKEPLKSQGLATSRQSRPAGFQHLRQFFPLCHYRCEIGAVLGKQVGLALGFLGADKRLQFALAVGDAVFQLGDFAPPVCWQRSCICLSLMGFMRLRVSGFCADRSRARPTMWEQRLEAFSDTSSPSAARCLRHR